MKRKAKISRKTKETSISVDLNIDGKVKEWFQAFSQSAGITLHIENIYGDNSHHIIESCFKGLARSLRSALEIDPRNKKTIPSTKGSL